ncbi:hypothetical protein FRC11_001850 [Ceratobasidium sp. 423]|nr:hypothetical protein FRC11_001850 [Ceratobasidium sp. 423]
MLAAKPTRAGIHSQILTPGPEKELTDDGSIELAAVYDSADPTPNKGGSVGNRAVTAIATG